MTYIIIDIDGVLNPFGARYNTQLNFTWLGDNKKGFFLKPDMHEPWIRKISEHATFVWGSAWAQESNLVLELLAIDGSWGWVPLPELPEEIFVGTWKLAPVMEWAEIHASDEKIVWLDDELEEDAFQWASDRGNTLAIRPDRYQGLTNDDFQRIYNFVSK